MRWERSHWEGGRKRAEAKRHRGEEAQSAPVPLSLLAS